MIRRKGSRVHEGPLRLTTCQDLSWVREEWFEYRGLEDSEGHGGGRSVRRSR